MDKEGEEGDDDDDDDAAAAAGEEEEEMCLPSTRPHNLGNPIQLQKEWIKMTEYILPVLTNTKFAYHPKSVVYIN